MKPLEYAVRYGTAAVIFLYALVTVLCMYESYWNLFVGYPVYGILYGLLVLVAFGWFGRIFGLSNLLWHEDGRTQFIAGVSVSMLMVLIAVISYEQMEDHDGDRFMADMRKFRNTAPIARLTGSDAWQVDHWETIGDRDLDKAYDRAITELGTGTDRWSPAILRNLFKNGVPDEVPPIEDGTDDEGGGDPPRDRSRAGEIDVPGGRKLIFEAYREFAGQDDDHEELYASRLKTMKNRWPLFFISASIPWIGILIVPAILGGTPLFRRPSQLVRPTDTPMTLGAGRGWFFVAGTVLVVLLALVAARWLPHLVVWLGKESGFYLIPDTRAGQGIWQWMRTTPRLFLQVIVSQVVLFVFLVGLLLLLRRPSLYRRMMTPVSLCLILAIFVLLYGIFVHLSYLHLLVQLGAAVLIGLLVLSQNRSAFKLRFPFMTLGESSASYYDSAHRVSITQFYTDTNGPADGHLYHVSRQERLDDSGLEPKTKNGSETARLLDSETVLDRWNASVPRNPSGGKPVLALVTTSGGSIRAAVWTAKVLTKLEREIPGFPYHVRLVTGASGGMLGAALYVADLDEPDRSSPSWPERPESKRAEAITGLPGDSLSAVARCLALRDLPGLIQWGPLPTDRGRALEEVWEKRHRALATPFRDLSAGEAAGWRPSLVFSPMLVEDGRRLIISNLDLEHMTTNVGSFLLDESSRRLPRQARRHDSEDVYSLSAYQFYRLFPRASAFRLSTAVRMSATFPFVSPAVSLPTHPPRRVVDAGYYDNFGINAAAMWILHHRDWLLEHTRGVVLIQIRAFDSPRDIHPPDFPAERTGRHSRSWGNGLKFLTSPIRGVAQARRAVMSFRNDEQLEVISDWFRDHAERPDFFQSVSFECPASASLSWHITNAERQEILDCFEPSRGGSANLAQVNQDRLDALKRWW